MVGYARLYCSSRFICLYFSICIFHNWGGNPRAGVGAGGGSDAAAAAAAVTIYRSLCPPSLGPFGLWLRPLRGRRNRIRMLRISSGDSARQSLAPRCPPPPFVSTSAFDIVMCIIGFLWHLHCGWQRQSASTEATCHQLALALASVPVACPPLSPAPIATALWQCHCVPSLVTKSCEFYRPDVREVCVACGLSGFAWDHEFHTMVMAALALTTRVYCAPHLPPFTPPLAKVHVLNF